MNFPVITSKGTISPFLCSPSNMHSSKWVSAENMRVLSGFEEYFSLNLKTGFNNILRRNFRIFSALQSCLFLRLQILEALKLARFLLQENLHQSTFHKWY